MVLIDVMGSMACRLVQASSSSTQYIVAAPAFLDRVVEQQWSAYHHAAGCCLMPTSCSEAQVMHNPQCRYECCLPNSLQAFKASRKATLGQCAECLA